MVIIVVVVVIVVVWCCLKTIDRTMWPAEEMIYKTNAQTNVITHHYYVQVEDINPSVDHYGHLLTIILIILKLHIVMHIAHDDSRLYS